MLFIPRHIPISQEDLFYLLSQETRESLHPGRIMSGLVTKITESGIHVKIEGRMDGIIRKNFFSDDPSHWSIVETLIKLVKVQINIGRSN